MSPEVSVIIPTFNRRAMTLEAVASVLAQRDVRFELVVVDDGSTDGTVDALDEALQHPTVPARVIQIANRGVAAARNLGVDAAQAKLIAFLDSDDLWMPSKLARQLAFMRDHPQYEISQCNEIWIRRGRRVNPGKRHLKREGDIFTDSLRTCLISPSAVIMKTDLFERMGGFDERMTAAEDYDLWLRILLHHQVGLLDEPWVTRRAGHPGQLSATIPAIDRFRILSLTKLLTNPDLTDDRRTATAEVLAQKCHIYAKGLRARHREGAFFERLAQGALERWRKHTDEDLQIALAGLSTMIST